MMKCLSKVAAHKFPPPNTRINLSSFNSPHKESSRSTSPNSLPGMVPQRRHRSEFITSPAATSHSIFSAVKITVSKSPTLVSTQKPKNKKFRERSAKTR